ncbi:zonadhesin-like [Amphibalanus amphitrite]|uniref:zonadhesin-like n=1 Tax=Amphibalanus amphitrite TaxID=1232801 RepID=UPI001C915BC4|nr:zonadhesin-like [Amphibalanus amphitrite]XP_043210318.1 zonadhesin-like [Amphibalanus amphitrite]
MWITPAALCLCLGLVTSAPTSTDRPEDALLAEFTSLTEDFGDLESMLDLNSTSAEDDIFADLLNSVLDDYDVTSLEEDMPFVNLTAISLEFNILTSEGSTSSEATASPNGLSSGSESATSTSSDSSSPSLTSTSEHPPSSQAASAPPATTVPPPVTTVPLQTTTVPPPVTAVPPPATTEEYEYDYYEVYSDFQPPTALPFSMFGDMQPRPPSQGDVLPSSCAWAVVQCCSNPDKLGSRVSCFSHVGCYGSWIQDFCTPEIKRVVFKSVFKSMKFSP